MNPQNTFTNKTTDADNTTTICEPRQWLMTQRQKGRDLVLIVNRMKGSDTLPALFEKAALHEYCNLYQGGEFDDLASRGPWLVMLEHRWSDAIDYLLNHASLNWGWIASAEQLNLTHLAQHWKDRLLIEENGRRFLYRFQDNRVMARHLTALTPSQIPLLLGPLHSALCWNGEHWLQCDNPSPALRPVPFPMPWADIPEPAHIAEDIRRVLWRRWVLENHLAAAQKVMANQRLNDWLDQQLAKADQWQWKKVEQLQFLLEQQLNPQVADLALWQPLTGETVENHFSRCQRELKHAAKEMGY